MESTESEDSQLVAAFGPAESCSGAWSQIDIGMLATSHENFGSSAWHADSSGDTRHHHDDELLQAAMSSQNHVLPRNSDLHIAESTMTKRNKFEMTLTKSNSPPTTSHDHIRDKHMAETTNTEIFDVTAGSRRMWGKINSFEESQVDPLTDAELKEELEQISKKEYRSYTAGALAKKQKMSSATSKGCKERARYELLVASTVSQWRFQDIESLIQFCKHHGIDMKDRERQLQSLLEEVADSKQELEGHCRDEYAQSYVRTAGYVAKKKLMEILKNTRNSSSTSAEKREKQVQRLDKTLDIKKVLHEKQPSFTICAEHNHKVQFTPSILLHKVQIETGENLRDALRRNVIAFRKSDRKSKRKPPNEPVSLIAMIVINLLKLVFASKPVCNDFMMSTEELEAIFTNCKRSFEAEKSKMRNSAKTTAQDTETDFRNRRHVQIYINFISQVHRLIHQIRKDHEISLIWQPVRDRRLNNDGSVLGPFRTGHSQLTRALPLVHENVQVATKNPGKPGISSINVPGA